MISSFLESLTLLDSVVLIINLLLILFTNQILKIFHASKEERAKRAIVFRSLNILIIASYITTHLSNSSDNNTTMLLLEGALISYGAFALMHIISYFVIVKYGRKITADDDSTYEGNYSSKLITLVINTLIFIVALISVIRVFGFNSLLETGGVIGFIGVFFALTHSSWSPDIFSGLIIINSDSIKDGDVIEYRSNNKTVIGVVWKTKLFHTEILNVVDGHKIMIWNSKLKSYDIQNLSSKASSKGLRENLKFNIGYDIDPANVRRFLNDSFEMAKADTSIRFCRDYDLEIGVDETGNYAVKWVVYYYIKNKDDIKNIVKTKQAILECFLNGSIKHKIPLATPQILSLNSDLDHLPKVV